jgi:hypothetical protein
MNYREFMFKFKIIADRNSPPTPVIDFDYVHKINMCTTFKLTSFCTICGQQSNLQNHHIRPIRYAGGKFTTFNAFDKLVATLGRKQITICKDCHNQIHSVKYNGLSLKDLFDVRLVAPKNFGRIPGEAKITIDPNQKNLSSYGFSLSSDYVIDPLIT